MAPNRAYRVNDHLHISVRGPVNGRWQVLCDRMREPLINAKSREAAFEFAMLLAVDHPPTTVELLT
jgi:hypothetical protein